MSRKPKFVIVRYGNIFDSRGSVIPLFKEIGNDPTQEARLYSDNPRGD